MVESVLYIIIPVKVTFYFPIRTAKGRKITQDLRFDFVGNWPTIATSLCPLYFHVTNNFQQNARFHKANACFIIFILTRDTVQRDFFGFRHVLLQHYPPPPKKKPFTYLFFSIIFLFARPGMLL